MQPVVLDFDQSVGTIQHAKHIKLDKWQENIRFASSWASFKELAKALDDNVLSSNGPVFLGSGDFHHVSYLLILKLAKFFKEKKLTVVVIDNHPDNMRYPFGIHCGSWISHAAALPFVDHVHVVGITSPDISLKHALENRFTPLKRSKLTYWSTDVNTQWANKIGLKQAFRSFGSVDDLVSSFIAEEYNNHNPIYLSIDKDALSPDVVKTNWDQGVMEIRHLIDIIVNLSPRIKACDITGDVSNYHYIKFSKRLMSWLDGQSLIAENDIKSWQNKHHLFNQELSLLLSKLVWPLRS